jgi:hypothetical protein
VKTRVAYPEALAVLKQFKAGDLVWVVRSGIEGYSDAVSAIRPAAANKIADAFVLPAELATTDAPNQYITIRLNVPAASLAAIKDVKPGQWVTVTSRHRPATRDDAVVSVRPYGYATDGEPISSEP